MRVGRLYRRTLVLSGVLVVAFVLGLAALHALRIVDLASIDARFGIRGSQGPAPGIVVVGIDDATFNYLDNHDPHQAHFPFARRLDARVVHNLSQAGAKVIAYDEQFTEPTDTSDDNALILAVRAARNVVLATTEVGAGGTTRIFGGGQGLAYSRAIPAEAQFPVDSDGVIRRMSTRILGLVTFPAAAVDVASGRPAAHPANASEYIDYRGPSGTFRTISYWRVLEGRFAADTVRGKIVVVGSTESILHDLHATPTDDQMSGPEVQANAIDTMLRGFPLGPGPGWLNVVLVVAFGMMAPLIALRRDAFLAAGAMLVGVAVLAVASQLAFDRGTIIGVVYPALAGALSGAATLALQGVRVAFEREQVRDTFARFVPESVVSEVLAQADGARLGGVRLQATVLFSDLRGFTSFAEQREPSETIEILNRYLTLMSDAILEAGGTLVAYMGDGIMAVFGAPIEQPDHASRALRAARVMLERLEEFNASLDYAGFKMGIGLNTGPVMSGNVGSERRLEYTAIGDTTNTASRLEGMTKGTPHQLYVAGTTYAELTEPPADLVQVGEFEVRGRAGRVTIWTLGEVRTAPEPVPAEMVTGRRR